MKDESHIVGREDFAENLVSRLIHEKGGRANLRVIWVVGEGAVGKTALARSVCNRADVKNHFDCCAWVQVGPKPNLVHLMADLLKQLSYRELRDVDLMDEEKLSDELLRLLMDRHYLIVLDDLCELHVMDELTMVLADYWSQNRVIVTTRDRNIPSSNDPWYFETLTLSPLDGEQSEKLLEKCIAASHAVDPPEELHLKERILSKSGGFPAKILLLGGLLSATTPDRCANLLTNGLPDRPTLQDVVRLSVNELPKELKQCALYMTLFPKESEIPTRRLFRLWSAEDLVSLASENGAEEFFKDLVSRHMVEVARQKWDGSARSCRLPGSLYDVLYQMAKNERFLEIYDCSIHDEGKFGASRVAIHRDISGLGEAKVQINVPQAGRERSETNSQEAHMEITPAEINQRTSTSDSSRPCRVQQLHSYVSFNTMKLQTRARDIAALLKSLKPERESSLLKVLDLEGVFKPSLPEELGNILPNLKYLGLRWTHLKRLPKLMGQLSHLETLDLKYTNISDLSDSIWEARNLRHLYMTEVNLDSKKSLNRNIQTIWGLCVGAGSDMLEELGKLTGLRKLALTWRGLAVLEATKHILNLEMLKYLRLRLKDPSKDPSNEDEKDYEMEDPSNEDEKDYEMKDPSNEDEKDYEMSNMSRLESLSNLYLLGYLGKPRLSELHIPPNLKVLTLSMSRLSDDPMGVVGKLECLTTLRLLANSYKGYRLTVSEGTFLSLRVLKLWKLESLHEWTIGANAMPCLADLEIKDCKKLGSIDGLQQIKNLELIKLVRVGDGLKRRVKDMQQNVPIIDQA